MKITVKNRLGTAVGEISYKALSASEGEIVIAGEIGYSWEGGTYKDLFETLYQAERKGIKNLLVRINSPGGDALEDGLGMLNLLLNSKMQITTRNEGLCGSMAFFLWLAGEKRETNENAMFMSHGVSIASLYGLNEQGLEDILKAVKSLNQIFANLLEKRGLTKKKAQEMLVGDNFFTATEAVEMGLATNIIPIVTNNNNNNNPQNEMNLYKKIANLFSAKTEEEVETQTAELIEEVEAERRAKEEAEAALAEAKSDIAKLTAEIKTLGEKVEALGKADAAPATTTQVAEADANAVHKGFFQKAFENKVKEMFS